MSDIYREKIFSLDLNLSRNSFKIYILEHQPILSDFVH